VQSKSINPLNYQGVRSCTQEFSESWRLAVRFFFILSVGSVFAQAKGSSIIIGVPSSFKSIEAAEGLKAITLAVEEINAKGCQGGAI